MKQNNPKGAWVRSSATPNRTERMKAHEEFEASELKKRLDNDWKITSIKKSRPRIHKNKPNPKRVKIAISGWEAMGTIIVSFGDYERDYKHCCKIVAEFF